jgi:hypothetical protein
MRGAPSNVIAACFALAAFTVAVMAGLAAANPAAQVLLRALVSMILCYPLGLAAGLVAQRVIEQHASALRAASDRDEARTANTPAPEAADDDEDVIVV